MKNTFLIFFEDSSGKFTSTLHTEIVHSALCNFHGNHKEQGLKRFIIIVLNSACQTKNLAIFDEIIRFAFIALCYL